MEHCDHDRHQSLTPDQFEVGQRVYWAAYEFPDFSWVGCGRHVVASGVVVTTGAAISTIWADEGSVRPHMVTKANDKVTANRDAVVAEIAPLNERITEMSKALLDVEMESLATAVVHREKATESFPRRPG